ncbi:MAG: replication-relaxation family protein [Acidimicrobiales bacterium]
MGYGDALGPLWWAWRLDGEDDHPSGINAHDVGDRDLYGVWRTTRRRVGARQLDALRAGLSERDTALLVAVGALHVVGTGQLRRLLFWDLTEQGSVRAAQRTLARLHHAGLVERLDRRIGGMRPGSSMFLWRLSSAGARIVWPDHNKWRRREPGLGHLAHVLDVAEVVVRLHEAARSGACRIIEVQTEPECWRRFNAPWGDKRILKPDLRVTVGVEGGEMHRFVEVDRDSEHRPVIDRKLAAYIHAWKDGGETYRAGVFPGVLWIVPTARRAEVIAERCCKTAAPAMFEVATNADIPDALIAGPRSVWAVA